MLQSFIKSTLLRTLVLIFIISIAIFSFKDKLDLASLTSIINAQYYKDIFCIADKDCKDKNTEKCIDNICKKTTNNAKISAAFAFESINGNYNTAITNKVTMPLAIRFRNCDIDNRVKLFVRYGNTYDQEIGSITCNKQDIGFMNIDSGLDKNNSYNLVAKLYDFNNLLSESSFTNIEVVQCLTDVNCSSNYICQNNKCVSNPNPIDNGGNNGSIPAQISPTIELTPQHRYNNDSKSTASLRPVFTGICNEGSNIVVYDYGRNLQLSSIICTGGKYTSELVNYQTYGSYEYYVRDTTLGLSSSLLKFDIVCDQINCTGNCQNRYSCVNNQNNPLPAQNPESPTPTTPPVRNCSTFSANVYINGSLRNAYINRDVKSYDLFAGDAYDIRIVSDDTGRQVNTTFTYKMTPDKNPYGANIQVSFDFGKFTSEIVGRDVLNGDYTFDLRDYKVGECSIGEIVRVIVKQRDILPTPNCNGNQNYNLELGTSNVNFVSQDLTIKRKANITPDHVIKISNTQGISVVEATVSMVRASGKDDAWIASNNKTTFVHDGITNNNGTKYINYVASYAATPVDTYIYKLLTVKKENGDICDVSAQNIVKKLNVVQSDDVPYPSTNDIDICKSLTNLKIVHRNIGSGTWSTDNYFNVSQTDDYELAVQDSNGSLIGKTSSIAKFGGVHPEIKVNFPQGCYGGDSAETDLVINTANLNDGIFVAKHDESGTCIGKKGVYESKLSLSNANCTINESQKLNVIVSPMLCNNIKIYENKTSERIILSNMDSTGIIYLSTINPKISSRVGATIRVTNLCNNQSTTIQTSPYENVEYKGDPSCDYEVIQMIDDVRCESNKIRVGKYISNSVSPVVGNVGSSKANGLKEIVDVSYANDITDYSTFASRISGVIMKVGEGVSPDHKDSKFEIHYDNFLKYNKAIGYYWFGRFDQDPILQAELFWSHIADKKNGVTFLDMEELSYTPSVGSKKEWAIKFINKFETISNRKIYIYSRINYLLQNNLIDIVNEDRKLWHASYIDKSLYDSEIGIVGKDPSYQSFRKYTHYILMRQYTDKAIIPGQSSGTTDKNYIFLDIPNFLNINYFVDNYSENCDVVDRSLVRITNCPFEPTSNTHYNTGSVDLGPGTNANVNIVNCKPGKIIAMGNDSASTWGVAGSYGTSMIVRHSDGTETLYGHMVHGSIPSNLKLNDEVGTNTKIGIIGNTGNSSGAHLHIETRITNNNIAYPGFQINTCAGGLVDCFKYKASTKDEYRCSAQ